MTITIPQKGFFKHNHVISGIGRPYLYTKGKGAIDGTGRMHVNLYGKCDICDKEIFVAIIHTDKNGTVYGN